MWRALPVSSWVRGAALYRKGSFEAAAKHYEAGLVSHSEHPARNCARMDLAYCLFQLGRLDESERELRKVSTALPRSREVHLRLARLQIWMGRTLDAVWTLRRVIQQGVLDGEVVGLFLFTLLEQKGPQFLFREALEATAKVSPQDQKKPLLQAATLYWEYLNGAGVPARDALIDIACKHRAIPEASVMLAKILLHEEKVAASRRVLREAMIIHPEHPILLTLCAKSYLRDGVHFQPNFARQLAQVACTSSRWKSPATLHVYAEALFYCQDKMSALLVASKAKEEGERVLGKYSDAKDLDQLLHTLSQQATLQ